LGFSDSIGGPLEWLASGLSRPADRPGPVLRTLQFYGTSGGNASTP
jgi:hypothetical protein